MNAREAEQQFVELMIAWLVSLPFDLKILYEAADDENLARDTREMAIGAVIYAVSPNDTIADRHDSFVSYCDDCVVIRLALHRALAGDNADAERFKQRFPEFFGPLGQQLTVCEQVMGRELYEWLGHKVEELPRLAYKGKPAGAYLDDGDAASLLYEDGLEFTTEYPIEEEGLADKCKKASTIVDFMLRRKVEEARIRT